MVPLTLVVIMTEFYYESFVTHMVNLRMDYSSDGHSLIVLVLQKTLVHNQQEVKRRVKQFSHSAALTLRCLLQERLLFCAALCCAEALGCVSAVTGTLQQFACLLIKDKNEALGVASQKD